MRLVTLTIFAATAAIVLATGNAVPKTVAPEVKVAERTESMGLPAGPLFGPLSPEEIGGDPVTVPEPVWASVLAASAVIFLRRGRR